MLNINALVQPLVSIVTAYKCATANRQPALVAGTPYYVSELGHIVEAVPEMARTYKLRMNGRVHHLPPRPAHLRTIGQLPYTWGLHHVTV